MTEDHPPTRDLLDEAIAAFGQTPVPERPSDRDLLARMYDCAGGRFQAVLRPSASKTHRRLLQFLVPSAAAAMLLIAGLGLLLLHGTAPIALADVVKAAGKHKLVRYNQQQITDLKEQRGTQVNSTIYADFTTPRLRSESRFDHPDGSATRLSIHDAERHLITDSRRKTAWIGVAPKDYKSLLCCLEEFQQKKGVVQSPQKLGTLTTVNYYLEELHQTTSLWIDPRTKLPVRLEQEFMQPMPDVSRNKLVWTDFAWDPELPSGVRNLQELFSTRLPEGYVLDDHAGDNHGR
jgi:hypothetical protein